MVALRANDFISLPVISLGLAQFLAMVGASQGIALG